MAAPSAVSTLDNDAFLASPVMAAILESALTAVRIAAKVAVRVQRGTVTNMSKSDSSPVTVADFAVQAIISTLLSDTVSRLPGPDAKAFRPVFRLIAEEDSTTLREGGVALGAAVVDSVIASGVIATTPWTLDSVCAAIDAGRFDFHKGSDSEPSSHYFVLDPIDGTKGFLRNGQYAVGLAYVVGGRPVMCAMACPHLAFPAFRGHEEDRESDGTLAFAVEGQGAWMEPLGLNTPEGERGTLVTQRQRIHVNDVSDARVAVYCESFDAGHSDRGRTEAISRHLGIVSEPIRIDSMCKYTLLARGEASVYLRFPRSGYRENVWDHAPGVILLKEAGGRVTDGSGGELDFSLGNKLDNNEGLVATNGVMHDKVLEAIRAASTAVAPLA